MTMLPSTLPILALPHPQILLPAARISLPLNRDQGDQFLAFLDTPNDDQPPLIAAVPITSPDSPDTVSQWGTTARIVRLVRPPLRNPRQPYVVTLQGLTRIRLKSPFAHDGNKNVLVERAVEHPDTNGVPSRESVEAFKGAALRLLDRLAKDASQLARKEGWLKVSAMVEDISESKASWMADVMVAAVNGEYSDKLSTSPLPITWQ
jgi:ATP-dependent Lon protease